MMMNFDIHVWVAGERNHPVPPLPLNDNIQAFRSLPNYEGAFRLQITIGLKRSSCFPMND